MQRIKDWPKPKTGKEVSTFLGLAGYYCTLSSILSDKLVEGDQDGREVCMKQNFEELKRVLTRNSQLWIW